MPYFQLVPSYSLLPGTCYLCKASQRYKVGGVPERIVDCGMDVLYEGRIYLCETCVAEIGNLLGAWVDPEDLDALKAGTVAALAELDQTRAALGEVQKERIEFGERVLARLARLATLSESEADAALDEAVDALKVPSTGAGDGTVPGGTSGGGKHPGGRPKLPRDADGRIIR